MLMPSVSGVITAPFTHISMRADGVPEVVENAEAIILTEETAQQQMASESMEHTKKRKGKSVIKLALGSSKCTLIGYHGDWIWPVCWYLVC